MSYKRFRASGKRGLWDRFWREGLRPRILANTEGDSIGEGQGLLAVGRGAAHSNTQGERNKSRGSFLAVERVQGRKGAKVRQKRQNATEDVTWGSQVSPQVYYKYGPSEGKSGSSVRPP